MNLPNNHRAAKATQLTYYFTGKPCRRGHLKRRFASTRQCEQCVAEHKARWRAVPENAAKDLAGSRRYNAENRELLVQKARARYAQIPERLQASSRAWKDRNREHVRAYGRRVKKENPALNAARAAAYTASKLEATPRWADLEAMRWFYEEAARLTQETGVKHEVDHIVPLRGRGVRGLHVPWNLRVITATENRRKYNLLIGGYAKCGLEVTRP